ncbi:DsrH/TusB family sulfur metabolism protein [Parashewanella tropica]|uniref:DsrH/TusB family sulfur relay protein n=1 Tax=Parashewanella tropica TaxID=2547970 RepID=UPI001059ABB4
MNLHIIQKQVDALDLCLSYTHEHDPLIITSRFLSELIMNPKCIEGRKVFILQNDLEASGLSNRLNHFNIINYPEFIELSLTYNKVVTW